VKKHPTILMIAPTPPPTTGQSLCVDILRRFLDSSGYTVTVLDLNKKALQRGFGSLQDIVKLLKLFYFLMSHDGKYESVYFTISESPLGNIKDCIIFVLLFRSLSKTTVHLHGGAGMRLLMADESIRHRINNFFLGRCKSVILLGESMTDIFKSRLIQKKIKIVTNFCPDSSVGEPEMVADKWRAKKLEGRLVFTFLSNMIPEKGCFEILEALLLLGDIGTNHIDFYFAGSFADDATKVKFEHLSNKLDFISFEGFVSGDRKRRLLEKTHVFVLPTYYPFEGQPVSILEAYAAGCAVITTPHSGIPDIFIDGVNGYFVEPASVDSLCAIFKYTLYNLSAVRDIGLFNYKIERLNYSESEHLKKMEKILSEDVHR